MKRFKKPKQKTFTYAEARDRALNCIKITMATQLVAAMDVANLDDAGMDELMEQAQYYQEHMEENRLKLKDVCDSLYKRTKIDIRLEDGPMFEEVTPIALRFWTPMIARKPAVDDWVLANYTDGTMGLDRRSDNPEFDNEVVAWMHLPTPYVEEDK